MFEKLKTFLQFLNKKSNTAVTLQVADNVIEQTPLVIIADIDYSTVESPTILVEDTTKPYLFILDDILETFILYSIDFKNIKRLYNKSVEEDFNVVQCFGAKAGFIAHKYIVLDKGKIDLAILDITLGYVVKLSNGDFVEHDGIDIAIKILALNPKAKILFSTAHTMRRRDPEIARYIDKFYNGTGLDIDNHYMNKNSYRVDRIYDMLYK